MILRRSALPRADLLAERWLPVVHKAAAAHSPRSTIAGCVPAALRAGSSVAISVTATSSTVPAANSAMLVGATSYRSDRTNVA